MNENERSTLEVYSVRREVRFSGVLPESSGLSEILYRIPSSYWDIPGQRGEPFTGVLPVTWREFRLHAVFEKRVVPLFFLIQLQLPEAPVVSSTLIFGKGTRKVIPLLTPALLTGSFRFCFSSCTTQKSAF